MVDDKDDPFGFQSTHPAWGGTDGLRPTTAAFDISIHPPRVGWDVLFVVVVAPH